MFENTEQLRAFHQLFVKGIITKEEYEAKKREILGLPKEENPKTQSSETVTQQVIQENKKSEPATQKRNNPLQSSKSLSANAIFFIVLGALVLAGAVFWFWNRNNESTDVTHTDTYLTVKDSIIQDSITTSDEQSKAISQEENEVLVLQLKSYYTTFLENEKQNANSLLFEDQQYIKNFESRAENNEDGALEISFYPIFEGYSSHWEKENDWKIGRCVGSFSFLFDTNKVNDTNSYLEVKTFQKDIDNDGVAEYLIKGYFNDCSGGSGSESNCLLTFKSNEGKFELIDVLIFPPVEFEITENNIVLKGDYKSWQIENTYIFNPEKKAWEAK
ncbi:MAG: SHOCT domain-containing protein [Cloacibacterium sp.]|nr:SHOCT domain-containing protein [Cloacibacterium sp.]